jgi:AraC-like DNA-binding protein
MHGDPSHDWTIESLAKSVGMSRSAFAARFAELVGEPPLHYLTHWRMTKAAQQLRESDVSIPAIASQVGYRSSAAFMKAFTRAQGVGPGAYRRAHRGEASVSSRQAHGAGYVSGTAELHTPSSKLYSDAR